MPVRLARRANDGVPAIGKRDVLSWKFLEASAKFRPSIAKGIAIAMPEVVHFI